MRIRFNFVLLIAIVVFTSCQNNNKKYYFDEGPIFGTFYHIVYEHSNDANLHDEIIAKMLEFDLSLSTYKPHSVISKVNNNDSTVVLDEYFLKVMKRADEISKVTNGAFDMTVAPLVMLGALVLKIS